MSRREHNPHQRRLYLPIVETNGNAASGVTATLEPDQLSETHLAHSVGCAQTLRPSGRRPEWLKVKARTGPNYVELKQIMRGLDLHTVCEEAGCPNIFECWEDREATFLVLGEKCTRRCGFCDVMTAKPDVVEEDEPQRIAEAVSAMGLRYVVLTGVARDDLPDGGARIWAESVRAIRQAIPDCSVEVLPPDFKGDEAAIATVLDAEPDVFAHNLETVRRLHKRIRPAFDYDRSLDALRIAKRLRPGIVAKSNLILGMGERPEEVAEAMTDLREADCDLLTLGQYLQPTKFHLPVDRWVTPEEFAEHARTGMAMGFAHVEAGPLVRSSYHAGRQLSRAVALR
ncbi:MAG TPA: lipoyl synthase [Actinomycetota bacterium]